MNNNEIEKLLTAAKAAASEEDAAKLYEQAAALGSGEAMRQLEEHYQDAFLDSDMENEDLLAQAKAWGSKAYERFNETGDKDEAADLAYDLGDFFQKYLSDYSGALSWFEKAAELGRFDAAMEVVNAYMTGTGTEPDAGKALAWAKRAWEEHQDHAVHARDAAYVIADVLTSLGKEAEALEWLERSAEGGNPAAMKALATAYRKGVLGAGQDDEKAKAWEEKAAHADGDEYLTDEGVFVYNAQDD